MKPTYKELLKMSVEDLANLVVAQGAKIQSLEAAHKDMKLRNSILRERKDLPVERLTAYNEIKVQAIEEMMREIPTRRYNGITEVFHTRKSMIKYVANLRGEK